MSYKYFISGSPTALYPNSVAWQNGFDAYLESDFYNAPNVYTIQQETSLGSGSYMDVDSRITTAISNDTGLKLSDDFKQLLFKPDHVVEIGYKYYFDENYWIVTNTNVLKSISVSALARRCNNVLKWTDQNGVIYNEPCIIDYKIAAPTNSTSDPIVGEGTIHLYTQINPRTNKIKENQRFLFGNSDNWMCYKVYGGGVKNYLNNKTFDNSTSTVAEIILGKNSVNYDTDDVINGVADAYKIVFLLSTTPSTISGGIGDSFQLSSVVTLNGTTVDKNVLYSTSSSAIATISGSGVVDLISTGSCVVTSYLEDNDSITDTVDVVVGVPVTENDVRVAPSDRYILQGDTQTYNVYLYEDGIQQPDIFMVSVADYNVPSNKYTLTVIDGNSFSIKNNYMYLDYPLVLNLTSGLISDTLEIELRGAW